MLPDNDLKKNELHRSATFEKYVTCQKGGDKGGVSDF